MLDVNKFSCDFAAVHGYLCSDGYVANNRPNTKMRYKIGFRNMNLVLLKDFQKRFEKTFGLRPNLSKAVDRCEVGSKPIHSFLIDNFSSFSSWKWSMPEGLPNKSAAFWLRAFFDAEGTVRARKGKDREISAESVNRKGLLQIKSALLGFGISCKITSRKARPTHTIYIFGKDNLERFHNKIGFLHPSKKAKLEEALGSYVSYTWDFPDENNLLTRFVVNKMRERAKVHKPGYIQMCSIIEENLHLLSENLQLFFGVTAEVYGPRTNKHSIYYELKIFRREDVLKIFENNLISKLQKQKLIDYLKF